MSRFEDDEPFEIEDVFVKKNSGAALLCRSDFFADDPEADADGCVWIPQSQIHEDSECYDEGHEGRLIVTGWLARERGWS